MVGVVGEMFTQLGIVVIITALAAFLLRLLKQPQILSYILVGILITPVFKIVTDVSIIQSMSTIGIAFLLFIVGLEMDVRSLKTVGFVSVFGASIQMALLFGLGYSAGILLHFGNLEALYLGLALAFSSTMVVVKLLSDKRELNTLHGRIVLGFLLLEDIVAIFVLSLLSSVEGLAAGTILVAFVKMFSLLLLAYLSAKFILPTIFRFAAKNQELLFILSLAMCFSFSLLFQYFGFSVAVGAFIAGIMLGNLQYNVEIIAKVRSLRDFFALLFFVSLGMGLSLPTISHLWKPVLVILPLVLIFKPFITMLICSIFRYTKKPSFLVANSLAQIGEFTLIIAAQGLSLGHISEDLFSLLVLIVIATITFTSYSTTYDLFFYKLLQRPLKIFDFFTTQNLEYMPRKVKPTIALCGYNRIGYSILENLEKRKEKVLIVDFNPEVISTLAAQGHNCLYGDVTDEEVLERMNLERIELMVSTVPQLQDNFLLIHKLKAANPQAKILVTASTIDDAMQLYSKGADYVILPHFLGGEHAANLISRLRMNKLKLYEEKERHLRHLQHRKAIGHEHPRH